MNHTLDAGIPLLTEVIAAVEIPTVDEVWQGTDVADISDNVDTHMFAEIDSSDHMALPASPSTITLSHPDWDKLQLEVHEKVLRQLQDRIDFVIEQHLRDSLANVLQSAVEGIAQQIKIGLHQTLNDVISETIACELAKFKKPTI